MEKLTILILIFFMQNIQAQTAKSNSNTKSLIDKGKTVKNQNANEYKVYDIKLVDVKPDFPGGIEKFQKFIRNNFKYYEEKIPVKGVVEVNFIVEKDGKLSNIHVIKDVGYNTGNEAIRTLKKSPKWNPGTHNHKLVRVLYQLSIPMDNSYNY